MHEATKKTHTYIPKDFFFVGGSGSAGFDCIERRSRSVGRREELE